MLKQLTARHYTAIVQFVTGVIIVFWTDSALVKAPAYLLIFMALFTWRTANPAPAPKPDTGKQQRKKKKKKR